MTLSLFNVEDDKVQKVFAWMPTKEQWWITGFNPYFTEPEPTQMVTISSVNFTNKPQMYYDFKNQYFNTNELDLIFDDEYKTIWITW